MKSVFQIPYQAGGTWQSIMQKGKLCQKFHARCMVAPVGLFSCDEERASAGLLLQGDAFIVRYTGMQEIEE